MAAQVLCVFFFSNVDVALQFIDVCLDVFQVRVYLVFLLLCKIIIILKCLHHRILQTISKFCKVRQIV